MRRLRRHVSSFMGGYKNVIVCAVGFMGNYFESIDQQSVYYLKKIMTGARSGHDQGYHFLIILKFGSTR